MPRAGNDARSPPENPQMTRPPITGDQRFVKSINRNVLLRLLLDEPAQSRAALAERSGLTKSTVSLLTKELLDEGWLAEDGVAVTGSLGRRPTPLRIAGRGLALIGAELGTDSIRVVSMLAARRRARVDVGAAARSRARRGLPPAGRAGHGRVRARDARRRAAAGHRRRACRAPSTPRTASSSSPPTSAGTTSRWATGSRASSAPAALGRCRSTARTRPTWPPSARPRSAAGPSTTRWSTSAAAWAWAPASSSTARCSPARPAPPARSATPSCTSTACACSCGRRGCAEAYVGPQGGGPRRRAAARRRGRPRRPGRRPRQAARPARAQGLRRRGRRAGRAVAERLDHVQPEGDRAGRRGGHARRRVISSTPPWSAWRASAVDAGVAPPAIRVSRSTATWPPRSAARRSRCTRCCGPSGTTTAR